MFLTLKTLLLFTTPSPNQLQNYPWTFLHARNMHACTSTMLSLLPHPSYNIWTGGVNHRTTRHATLGILSFRTNFIVSLYSFPLIMLSSLLTVHHCLLYSPSLPLPYLAPTFPCRLKVFHSFFPLVWTRRISPVRFILLPIPLPPSSIPFQEWLTAQLPLSNLFGKVLTSILPLFHFRIFHHLWDATYFNDFPLLSPPPSPLHVMHKHQSSVVFPTFNPILKSFFLFHHLRPVPFARPHFLLLLCLVNLNFLYSFGSRTICLCLVRLNFLFFWLPCAPFFPSCSLAPLLLVLFTPQIPLSSPLLCPTG